MDTQNLNNDDDLLIINEPFWKHKALGINESYFNNNKTDQRVACSYVKKNGERQFPHMYRCNRSQAVDKMRIKGATLLIIPVANMEVERYSFWKEVDESAEKTM